MTTPVAARYCGYKTAWGLLTAFHRGRVKPHGRRGGSGVYTWRREELDPFLAGGPAEDIWLVDRGEPAPTVAHREPRSTWRGQSRGDRELEDILRKIRTVGSVGQASVEALGMR